MLFHCLGEAAEDDAFFGQGLSEGGGDGNRVKHGIHGHYSCQHIALLQGNAQLVEGFGQFGVNLLGAVFIFLGSREVDNILKINFRHVQMRPVRLRHGLPLPEGIQAELQQPLRFFFPGRYHAHDLLVQAFRDELLLHIGHKAFLVLSGGKLLYDILVFRHNYTKILFFPDILLVQRLSANGQGFVIAAPFFELQPPVLRYWPHRI